MTDKYNSLFQDVLNFVRGTPMAAWLLLMSILMTVIGVNGFIEDTNSSYIGIQQLETAFNVRATSWELTYLLMSLFFQIISIVTFFMYLSNRERNWVWLWVSLLSQVIDLVADIWYRSNGDPFQSVGSLLVSTGLTLIFFTIGSEVALTLGMGLTAKLFVEGMTQLSIVFWSFLTGISKFMKNLSDGTSKSNSGSQNNAYRSSTPPPPQQSQKYQPSVPHHYTDNKSKYGGGNRNPSNPEIVILPGGRDKDHEAFR